MGNSKNSKKRKRAKLTKAQKKMIWKNATITNDFIFSKLMRIEKIAKKVVSIILGVPVKKVEIFEYQKVIDLMKGQKSIRMDVYLEGTDAVYNVEMQVLNRHNLRLRARFYRSMLDLNLLEEGKNYSELKKSYVIFICMFDLFGKKQPKYIFQNMCKLEDGSYIALDDDSYTVFLNANAYINEKDKDLSDFLAYLKDSKVNNKFIAEIDNEVKKIKSNNLLEVEYMTFYTNYIDEIELIKKEYEQKQKEHLLKQLEILDDKAIAILNDLTLEEVVNLRKNPPKL